jgi:hypothetical protein
MRAIRSAARAEAGRDGSRKAGRGSEEDMPGRPPVEVGEGGLFGEEVGEAFRGRTATALMVDR